MDESGLSSQKKNTVGTELSARADGDPSNQIWVWRMREDHMGSGITLELGGVKSEVARSHLDRESSGHQCLLPRAELLFRRGAVRC